MLWAPKLMVTHVETNKKPAISYSQSRVVTETWSVGFHLGMSADALKSASGDASFSVGYVFPTSASTALPG